MENNAEKISEAPSRYEIRERFRQEIKETATRLKAHKDWERTDHRKRSDTPPNNETPDRATFICTLLAHSRGRQHLHWWKKYYGGYEIESLAVQEKWLRDWLNHFEQMKTNKWFKPFIDAELQALARLLLDRAPLAS